VQFLFPLVRGCRGTWKLALLAECGRVVRQYAELRVQGGESNVAVEHLDLAVAQIPEVGGREGDRGPRRLDRAAGVWSGPRKVPWIVSWMQTTSPLTEIFFSAR